MKKMHRVPTFLLLNCLHLDSAAHHCDIGPGGLLSEDSPFLDIVREGLKLALPSAEVVHPRVEPAHGAALLIQDRLFGGSETAEISAAAGPSGIFKTPERPRHHHHRRTPSSQGESFLGV